MEKGGERRRKEEKGGERSRRAAERRKEWDKRGAPDHSEVRTSRVGLFHSPGCAADTF